MTEGKIVRRKLGDRPRGPIDWSRFDAMTDADIDQQVADDPDLAPIMTEEDMAQMVLVQPMKKHP